MPYSNLVGISTHSLVARSVYFLVLVFLAVAVETATVAVAEAVPMFIIGQTCLSQPLISTVQEENHTRGELFPGRRDVRALGGVGRPGGNLALLRTVGPSTERAESANQHGGLVPGGW